MTITTAAKQAVRLAIALKMGGSIAIGCDRTIYESSPTRIKIFIPGRGSEAGDPDPSHVSVTVF